MIFKKLFLAGFILGWSWLVAMESKPNLILDLDDVFLHSPSQVITNAHQLFSQKSFLVQDSFGYNYIVPAYTPEFLKFVTARFVISFFSSGIAERNRSVIKDIWYKVFGTTHQDNVCILSRDDLACVYDRDLNPPNMKYYGLENCILSWDGLYKKDITKIGPLHNTVLVDDANSYVHKDQIRNLLLASGTSFDEFTAIQYFRNKAKYNYNDIIEIYVSNSQRFLDMFAFYKLTYITGVLDLAAQHEKGIIEGLYAIQFKEGQPNYLNAMKNLLYYKRGYKVLSQFTDGTLPEHFPEIEKYLRD